MNIEEKAKSALAHLHDPARAHDPGNPADGPAAKKMRAEDRARDALARLHTGGAAHDPVTCVACVAGRELEEAVREAIREERRAIVQGLKLEAKNRREVALTLTEQAMKDLKNGAEDGRHSRLHLAVHHHVISEAMEEVAASVSMGRWTTGES